MEQQAPILVAPDAFKGTITASAVADAVARGLESAGRPATRCPLADGGEGTLDVLVGAGEAEIATVEVSDPLGRQVEARIALFDGGATAAVETAEAIGIARLRPDELDPGIASSLGAGELIAAAAATGAERVITGLGGSATIDGGVGALAALDEAGLTVDRRGRRRGPLIVALCDVRTPWEDAAAIYGPQKGADPTMIEQLARSLECLATGMRADPRGRTGSGAAGGLAGALWSQCRAELAPGASFVLDQVGFDQRMRTSRAVVVGEGRLDSTTLLGKAPGEAATRARQAGFGCAAVCGVDALDPVERRILDLQVVIEAGDVDALIEAGRQLADLI